MDQIGGVIDILTKALVGFVTTHPYWSVGIIVGYFVLSNAANALPSASQDSSPFYKWFFGFANGIFGALPRIFPALRLWFDPTRQSTPYFKKTDGGSPAPNPPGGGK